MCPFNCSETLQNVLYITRKCDVSMVSEANFRLLCIGSYLLIAVYQKIRSDLHQNNTIKKALFSYVWHFIQNINNLSSWHPNTLHTSTIDFYQTDVKDIVFFVISLLKTIKCLLPLILFLLKVRVFELLMK